jgi:hypothetical protein
MDDILAGNLQYMYSKLPNLVIGFHGCEQESFDNVIMKKQSLKKSNNKYDWLGNGVYFWENSYERALEWASSKKHPAVVGAIIDLGNCLNLTDYYSSEILKRGYELLKKKCEKAGIPVPCNKRIHGSGDFLLRDLDCAVIEEIHLFNKENNIPMYDSVRGVFTEGDVAFPGSCFLEKTHIQLCVVNPNCIKGYFNPLKTDEKYPLP